MTGTPCSLLRRRDGLGSAAEHQMLNLLQRFAPVHTDSVFAFHSFRFHFVLASARESDSIQAVARMN